MALAQEISGTWFVGEGPVPAEVWAAATRAVVFAMRLLHNALRGGGATSEHRGSPRCCHPRGQMPRDWWVRSCRVFERGRPDEAGRAACTRQMRCLQAGVLPCEHRQRRSSCDAEAPCMRRWLYIAKLAAHASAHRSRSDQIVSGECRVAHCVAQHEGAFIDSTAGVAACHQQRILLRRGPGGRRR